MDLSIVVTHYRDLDLLHQCLKTLEKNLKDISREIIVVLSEYQPEILEELQSSYPGATFLPFKENLYFVRSVNRGLEKARGKFILVINDDVVISESSVKLLIEFLRKNPDVGLIGPKVLYPDGTKQHTCFRFYSPLTILCRRTALGKANFCGNINRKFLYQDKNIEQRRGLQVDWLMNGAGVMTSRKALEIVGFLDKRFKHYFSDVDWSRRFWQKGLKVVYFPEASFVHHHGKRSGGQGLMRLLDNKMVRVHVWDGIKYFLKWGIWATPMHRLYPDDADGRFPPFR